MQPADIFFFILLPLLVTLGIVRGFVVGRRAEERVRGWARENGYAIVTIERKVSVSDYALYIFFGWLGIFLGPVMNIGTSDFRVLIQDEQGGQRHVLVSVSKPGKPVEVQW